MRPAAQPGHRQRGGGSAKPPGASSPAWGCWRGGKRGLRVVRGGKAARGDWGDTNARKTLINDHIVAPCGLKGKGKGRGRDKGGG